MKKFLVLLISLSLILPQTASAQDFSDLNEFHKNYQAITYLQNRGILKGYQDGTFQPSKSVNRAEFLKIILEGSSVPLDKSEVTPFTDVVHSAWYAPYIKKAYHEGWVNGYGDNTFRPTQTINKVEALKIISEVQGWNPVNPSTHPFQDVGKTAWFAKFVAHAKQRNFLEENSTHFTPGSAMTRAKVSEVIYRTSIANQAATPATPTPTPEPIPEPEITETPTPTPEPTEEVPPPLDPAEISASFFKNITLDTPLPNIFYEDEVYFITGKALEKNAEKVSIILADPNSGKILRSFEGKVKNGKFSAPVHFDKSMDYHIGIISGNQGTTKITKIQVANAPAANPSLTTPPTPKNLHLSFKGDQTFLNFEASTNPSFKKLTFFQNQKTVTLYSRQSINSVPLSYSAFGNFTKGKVKIQFTLARTKNEGNLQITSEFSKPLTETFSITNHHFTNIEEDKIPVSLPTLLAKPQKISFTTKATVDARQEAFVILPNGQVESITLETITATEKKNDNTIIPANSQFTYSYTPPSNGIYILEVNDANGLALINHPVYIGTAYPLVPDYFDSNERVLTSGKIQLTAARQSMLSLINKARTDHGLSPIVLSTELNSLAQGHSDDMKKNNFFGHVNLQGQTSNDRRIAAGIKTTVGENLAKDVSLEFAHAGLMRSAGHRETILNPHWEKVGLGISIKNGYYIVAEEFSTKENAASDLNTYKGELIDAINAKRASLSFSEMTTPQNLEDTTQQVNGVLVSGQSLSSEILGEALSSHSIYGQTQAVARSFGIWKTILDTVIAEDDILFEEEWQRLGVDIQLDKNGNLKALVLINKDS